MQCSVTFRITAPIGAGETVHILGDAPVLGAWQLHGAVPLVTTAESYPLWFTSKPLPVPCGQAVEYKYVVFADGKAVRFENIEGNRVIFPRGREIMVEDVLDVQPPPISPLKSLVANFCGVEDPSSPLPSSLLPSTPLQSAPLHPSPLRPSPAGASGGPQPQAHAQVQAHALAQVGIAGQGRSAIVTSQTSPGLHTAAQLAKRDSTATDAATQVEAGASQPHEAHGPKPSLMSPPPGSVAGSAAAQTNAWGQEMLTDADSVLLVQFRLPLKITRRVNAEGGVIFGEYDFAWDEEALLSPKGIETHNSLANLRVKWIGTPALSDVTAEEEDILARALDAYRCIPIFLPEAILKSYYDGYCRDTLWPIFHNVIDVYGELPTRWWLTQRQNDRWKAYMDANQRFASAVVENFHEGDLVWIQDYHLLLVPMLLARRHIAPVGVFLHIPFPSSEIFRSLSMRDEILRGMLHADHVGFHLFEYARHFLTSCRRVLGLTHSSKRGGVIAVDYQGREVQVTVSHVGIEPDFLLRKFTTTPTITRNAAHWRSLYPGCSIIGGVDSIERLKGVSLKLVAYEAFLAQNPHFVGKVVMVQYCVADTMRPGDKQEISVSEIVAITERINARYTTPAELDDQSIVVIPPVHLVLRAEEYVPVEERLALWAAADVFMNTAIRDGLNLLPFEYAFTRGSAECVPVGVTALRQSQEQVVATSPASFLSPTSIVSKPFEATQALIGQPPPESPTLMLSPSSTTGELNELADLTPGILILSEFSGCSRVLSGALRVNPWQIEDVVAALTHALTMTVDEQAARAASNIQYVTGNTTSSWAERVLMDLKAVSKRSTSRTYMGYGLGLGYRLMGFGSSFKPLNFEHVVTAFKQATHRLIVCDYGGTLNVRDSSSTRKHAFELGLLGKDAAPPLTAEIKKSLKTLSEDPHNTVFIISGKEKDVLQQAFNTLPHVGLAAEHGFYFRWGSPVQHKRTRAVGFTGPASPAMKPSRSATSIASAAWSVGSGYSDEASHGHGPVVPPTPIVVGASPALVAAGDNGIPWQTMQPSTYNEDWKSLACGIMESYARRTNGTYTLKKGSALSWFYGDADPEFGSMQAKELQDHLSGVLASHPVDVLAGHNYVEVRPRGINKGAVLALLIDILEGCEKDLHASKFDLVHFVAKAPSPADVTVPDLHGRHGSSFAPDVFNLDESSVGSELPYEVPPGWTTRDWKPRPLEFILCIGDDAADEEMFEVVHAYRKDRTTIMARVTPAHAAALVNSTTPSLPQESTSNPATSPERQARSPAAVAAALQASTRRLHDVAIVAAPRVTKFGVNVLGNANESPTSADAKSGHDVTSVSAVSPAGHTLHDFTVTVGKKPSAAQYFVDDTQQVEDLFRVLARATNRHKPHLQLGIPLRSPEGVVGPASATLGRPPVNRTAEASLTQVALAQAYHQRLKGRLLSSGSTPVSGIAMMSMPAGMDSLSRESTQTAVPGISLGKFRFTQVTPVSIAKSGQPAPDAGQSPLIQTGTRPVAGHPPLPAHALSAKIANVQTGMTSALAGLYASTGRLQGLAAVSAHLLPVDETAHSPFAHTPIGSVSDELNRSDSGSDSDDFSEDEIEDDIGANHPTPLSEPIPHAPHGLFMAGRRVMSTGMIATVASHSAPLDFPRPARPAVASTEPPRSKSFHTLSGAAQTEGATDLMSHGLTEYLNQIAEGNQEDVPEF